MAEMPQSDLDFKLPPFDQLKGVRPLAANRRGATSHHARHHLFAAQDKRSGASVLIKLTSKPGIVYQQNLANEIAEPHANQSRTARLPTRLPGGEGARQPARRPRLPDQLALR